MLCFFMNKLIRPRFLPETVSRIPITRSSVLSLRGDLQIGVVSIGHAPVGKERVGELVVICISVESRPVGSKLIKSCLRFV